MKTFIKVIPFVLVSIIILTSFNINQTNAATLQTPQEKNLKEYINALCKQVRKWGTEGEKQASIFINQKMKDFSYTTENQTFAVYRQDTQSFFKVDGDFFELNPYNSEIVGYTTNVIAIKKSKNTSAKTLIVSAHYDSVSKGDGAVDNASGVSTLLEVARILQNTNLPFNLQFVFFGAEENLVTGSRYFVSNLTDSEAANIIGCINVDCVGQVGAGNLEFSTPLTGQNILVSMYQTLFSNKPIYWNDIGLSDEFAFTNREIPALTLSQENLNHLNINGECKPDCLDIFSSL